MDRKYWLFKSDPGDFSWNNLENSSGQSTCWSGVRNYQARNFLRDEIKPGDEVLFYHSNDDPPSIIGICTVIKEGYADITQFDPDNPHYFPSASETEPVWYMVDIKLKEKFKNTVSLTAIKNNPKLADLKLIQKGNRLSVMPVTKEEFEEILKMGNH